MRRKGEIIVIEDDEDDRLLLKDIFDSLDYPNKVVFFADPMDVIPYLSLPDVNPFIIFSDINMPKIDGFELRQRIAEITDIDQKCTPYIFLSTSKDPDNVIRAFKHSVQGYFKKESDFNLYKANIQHIVEYWLTSLTPSSTF